MILLRKNKPKSKIMNKRKFYQLSLLYWLYTLVWLVSGTYVYYFLDISNYIKFPILVIMALVTPDLPTFVQSYSTYRKNVWDFDDPNFQRVREMKGKYTDGFMISGIEISLDIIKTRIIKCNWNCILELYKEENVVVFKESEYDGMYHRCYDNEWEGLIQFINASRSEAVCS